MSYTKALTIACIASDRSYAVKLYLVPLHGTINNIGINNLGVWVTQSLTGTIIKAGWARLRLPGTSSKIRDLLEKVLNHEILCRVINENKFPDSFYECLTRSSRRRVGGGGMYFKLNNVSLVISRVNIVEKLFFICAGSANSGVSQCIRK